MVGCPKCGGKLDWKDRCWTTAGEDPGHWRCVNCGKVIYQNRTDLQKWEENTSSANCGEKGGQEIITQETKVCTNPKCPKPNPQPISEFNKNAARPGGIESRCRTCTAQAQRDLKASKLKASGSNGGHKSTRQKSRSPYPRRSIHSDPQAKSTDEAIFLEKAILLAIEKKVALKLLKWLEQIVQEAYA